MLEIEKKKQQPFYHIAMTKFCHEIIYWSE